MNQPTTIIWQLGTSNAPLPPVVSLETADESLRFYLEHYQTHGPIFQIPYPDRQVTVLAGPEANFFVARESTEVLGHQMFWKDFDKAYANRDLGRAGEANRQRRAMVSRSYSRGRILGRVAYLAEITREFTQTWQAGQCIDLYPLIQKLAARQLGQLLTHYEPGEYFADLVTFLRTTVLTTVTREQAQTALQDPEYLLARKSVLELGKAIVEAHRDGSREKHEPDVVDDALLAIKMSGREVADEQLAYSALGPFLAGLDTVSAASCYALYLLLKNPQALERVVAEIDHILLEGELSWEKLKNMEALHGTVMETLRLYPLSIGFSCQAIQPFIFANHSVEAGREIFVAMTVPHFLPDVFPDPLHFDLDRYSELRNEHRQRGAYAPFGIGDRSCLGSGIAEVQLVAVLAVLLSHFQFELVDPALELPPLEKATIWKLREHFQVRVTARRAH